MRIERPIAPDVVPHLTLPGTATTITSVGAPEGADNWLAGSWSLLAWRRVNQDDGTVTFPLGPDARGSLVYTQEGSMSVHVAAADRPPTGSPDPLGGDEPARAAAYSTYLAYWGTYELHPDVIVHHIDTSLYPAWTGQEQSRAYTYDGAGLTLRTPPMQEPDGSTVVNELVWARRSEPTRLGAT